jgi:hypothetical protein
MVWGSRFGHFLDHIILHNLPVFYHKLIILITISVEYEFIEFATPYPNVEVFSLPVMLGVSPTYPKDPWCLTNIMGMGLTIP